MSHWDFGRPSAGEHDAPRPGGPFGTAADDDWVADDNWTADDGTLPPHAGGGSDVDDDGDEELAPYPITYERDPWHPDGLGSGATEREREQAPPLEYPRGPVAADQPAAWQRDAWQRDAWQRDAWQRQAGEGGAGQGLADRSADPGATGPGGTPADGTPDGGALPGAEAWADWELGRGRPHRKQDFRRWLFPAGLAAAAAALGAGAVLVATSHSGGGGNQVAQGTQGAQETHAAQGTQAAQGSGTSRAPSAASSGTASASASAGGPAAAALTMAQAQEVLAGYTTTNNMANAQRSDTLLAGIETGSSYAIDAALYQAGRAVNSAPFAPFSPVRATYYLPRGEPAAGPRWFAVQVANAFTASPAKISSSEYVLFTQAVPGGAWRDTVEPYLLPGASAVKVALGADGLATAVSPGTAGDAVAPGQLAALTAASLDGAASGQSAVADPGNLADGADLSTWRKEVPGGKVSVVHAAASGADGPEFALLTAGGGALVFYTDTASLTVTPPPGSVLHVTVPGLYSPGQALTRAGVSYLEQFAAYDPPAGGGAPRVVADFSAITGKS